MSKEPAIQALNQSLNQVDRLVSRLVGANEANMSVIAGLSQALIRLANANERLEAILPEPEAILPDQEEPEPETPVIERPIDAKDFHSF